MPAVAPVIIGVTALGAITLVGIQQQYQNRSNADRSVVGQLATLIPNPPPDTIFVPVRIDATASATGMLFFDRLRPGAFETIWSATAITRQTFHRRDLWAAGWNPWKLPLLDDATGTDVRLTDRFVIWSPFRYVREGGVAGTRLPWSHVVPFVVEPAAGAGGGRGVRVRLVRRVVFESEDGTELAIQPPIVHERLTAREGALSRSETCVFRTMREPNATAGLTPLPPWQWSATGKPAEPRICRAWPGQSNTRQAVWMHPDGDSGSRSSLTTVLPPSDSARRLVIRAAITEYDLNRNAASDPMVLALTVDTRPAAEITIRRARFRSEQTWLPLVATIPASTAPVTLNLSVKAAPLPSGAEPKSVLDPLWVTTGQIRPSAPDDRPRTPVPPDADADSKP
jgi:hypothetical protein